MAMGDKISRRTEELKGKVKIGLGAALDDKEMEAEGREDLQRSARTAEGAATADEPSRETRGAAESRGEAPARRSESSGTVPDGAASDRAASDRAGSSSPEPAGHGSASAPAQSPPPADTAGTGDDRRGVTHDRTGGRPEPTDQGAVAEGTRQHLLAERRADEYTARWAELKNGFVDEPRQSVRQADQLVGDILEELQDIFSAQRRDLEHGLDTDKATTEDLRTALGRYRRFFDRLLSI
jgi:hypothetical protein